MKAAGVQTALANEKYAVLFVWSKPGTVGAKTLPPAVYPVPVISLAVVYEDVVLDRLALAVYRAILYV